MGCFVSYGESLCLLSVLLLLTVVCSVYRQTSAKFIERTALSQGLTFSGTPVPPFPSADPTKPGL